MGLGVWFDYDVRNILRGLTVAALGNGHGGEYERGYRSAIAATALAFGLADIEAGLQSRAGARGVRLLAERGER